MAVEEDVLEDEELEEDEIPEAKEKDKKPSKAKKIIFNILAKVLKTVFVIALIFSIFYVPYLIVRNKDEKVKLTHKNILEEDVYAFPKPQKKKALASFKFPTLRESEEKEFKIKLDDMKTIVTLKLFLGYDEQNQELKEELDKRLLEIIDKINFIIGNKSYRDINTIEKREINLKKELINEINSILYSKDRKENKIEDLYFTQFFITRLK
ncbi:MAG: flagellar basal body-associated FliL family protein [Spirochaetota bacterium]|nr:flagellar basal body-associated FliL family protein [Spirochaetota bacterium]